MSSSEDDRERLDMKETVEILDECLKAARNPSIGINQVCGYKFSNPRSTEYFPIAIDECQPSKRVARNSTSIPIVKIEEATQQERRRRKIRTSQTIVISENDAWSRLKSVW